MKERAERVQKINAHKEKSEGGDDEDDEFTLQEDLSEIKQSLK